MIWSQIESESSEITKVKNHTATYYKNQVYIYGGFDGSKHKNSLNVLDTESHSIHPQKTSGPLPSGRNGHTSTLSGSDIYIIGGWNSSIPSTTQEIFVLHLETLTWEKIEPLGETMVSCNMHSANLYKSKIFVFRGGDGTNYLNTLHSYDIETNVWSTVNYKGKPPSPRANHASCINKSNLYIFGGWNGVDRLNDLVSLNLETIEWNQITNIGDIPRPRAGMSLNSLSNGLLMFGGSGVSCISYNDMYYFSLETQDWKECKFEGRLPSPRAGHSLTAISKRHFMLFGGSSGLQYSSEFYLLDIHPLPVFKFQTGPLPLEFRDFCNNPQFSDVQFVIEGKRIYAHKVIITRLSEHLHKMFTSEMRESRENVIEFKGIRYCIFMILLKYLYSGDPQFDAGTEGQEMSTDFLLEVLQNADRFFLDPIIQVCERLLIERVTSENVLSMLSIIENTNSPNLKEYCNWIISENNL